MPGPSWPRLFGDPTTGGGPGHRLVVTTPVKSETDLMRTNDRSDTSDLFA